MQHMMKYYYSMHILETRKLSRISLIPQLLPFLAACYQYVIVHQLPVKMDQVHPENKGYYKEVGKNKY